jgi:RNA 2',3'-cyclic 3'-phosphodiesterase
LRCFVALVPPRSLVDRLAEWGEEAFGSLDGVRPVAAESLHVTLAFLGELDQPEVERAGAIVSGVVQRRIRLRLEPQPVRVPKGRPRVLALNEVAGEAAAVQSEVAGALIESGLLEPKARPFWSHLTVARVKRGALDGARGRDLAAALPEVPAQALGPSHAESLSLLRSEPGPQGSRYTPLATVRLPGGRG